MILSEAIARADAVRPNAYTNDEKTRWLSEVEGDIGLNILLLCHESIPEYTDYDSDKEKVLMIRPPYDKIYVDWLIAKIDLANAEYSLYANSLAVYNADYDSLSKWVSLRVHPADRKAIWHGYYLIGERGEGIEILGLYDTLEDLEEAHPVGEKGNVYAVGTAASNVLYVWQVNPVNDETPGEWVSIGSLKGADGVSPTLDISENGTWVINGEDTGVLADVNRISEDVEAWKNEAASSASDAGDAKDRAESAENAASGYAGQALTYRDKAEEYAETSLASASAAVASAAEAASSASAASSSATEASASASSAASSATAAEASAQEIEDLTVSATALPEGSDPTVTKTGGDDDPYHLAFGIPKGDTGEQGETGNGIVSITKTGTEGAVDTYTITFTDGTTSTFTVTNGSVTSVNARTGAVTGLAEESDINSLDARLSGEIGDIKLLKKPVNVAAEWRDGYFTEGANGNYNSTSSTQFAAALSYISLAERVGQTITVNVNGDYTSSVHINFLVRTPTASTTSANLIRRDTIVPADGATQTITIPDNAGVCSIDVKAINATRLQNAKATTSVILTRILFSDFLDADLTSKYYPAQGKAVGDAISRLSETYGLKHIRVTGSGTSTGLTVGGIRFRFNSDGTVTWESAPTLTMMPFASDQIESETDPGQETPEDALTEENA